METQEQYFHLVITKSGDKNFQLTENEDSMVNTLVAQHKVRMCKLDIWDQFRYPDVLSGYRERPDIETLQLSYCVLYNKKFNSLIKHTSLLFCYLEVRSG